MSESGTTGRDLIDFLDWAIEKNELVPSTASALRTGCLKVLEATDGWETQEVTPDVAAPYLERFRNANQNKLKERTRDVYARRFQQAVDMNARRAAGEEWKPKERATQRRPAPGAAASARPSKEGKPVEEPSNAAPPNDLVDYPFPLRPELLVHLQLPRNLQMEEAERIATFVTALAVPPEQPQNT